MTEVPMASGAARSEVEAGVPISALAWVLVAATYAGTRFAAAFTLPVFGTELDHISGAWQASIGASDGRYVPTLFQAVTALLLRVDDSELWPRLVAAAISSTVPIALWLGRRDLGAGAALLALALLALDAIGLGLGASASAMALDGAVSVWTWVVLSRWPRNLVAVGAIAFAVPLCCPAPLLVVCAWAVTRRDVPGREVLPGLAVATVAATVALVLSSWRFGLGFDELVVPPFDLLAAGSERAWSTASGGELTLLYQAPLVLGAVACLVLAAARVGPRPSPVVATWLAFAGGWWLFSLGHENPAPAAAVAVPAAIVLARPLMAGFERALRVDVAFAAAGIGIVVVCLLLAGAVVADWARLERVGDSRDQALVAMFGVVALLGVALAIYGRAGTALLLPAVAIGAIWMLPGTVRVAIGAGEPFVSPRSAPVASDLRDAAVASRDETGGAIVVHPSLEEAITWPFRDSGVLLIASRVPATANFVIWPIDEPPPEGFTAVAGDWALTETIRTPTADLLDYLHWLLDRNTLAARPDRIAVYTREER